MVWKLFQRSPNLSKANSAPLLVLLQKQVKPGGFNWVSLWGLVWFPEVKKPQNFRSKKKSKHELWKGLFDPKRDKARKGQRATGRHSHASLLQQLTCCTNIRQRLAKTPSPKLGGYLGNTLARERSVGKTTATKNQLLVYSASCNHKVACEEETLLNPRFCSNISEQLK